MDESTNVGKLGLEGLMDRANIIFTNGYRFKGSIDETYLANSIKAVCKCVIKFKFQFNYISPENTTWELANHRDFQLNTRFTSDLDLAFANLCSDSFIEFDKANGEPMLLTLIKNTNDLIEEFIICQSCCHTYVDARSAEVIFNNIIQYYNALTIKDASTAKTITEKTLVLRTVDSQRVIEHCFAQNPHADHDQNIEKLNDYNFNDFGKHVIPKNTLEKTLNQYRKQVRTPLVQYFNIDNIIDRCRMKYPNTSKNSVVCAVIAKAIYNINVKEKGVNPHHNICFKMVSDILTTDLRQKYSGNYIAFIPVCIEGDKALEDMAKDINDWVVNFKMFGLNTSVFSLTEKAINKGVVGNSDDPLSFIVTNWNNYAFLNTKMFLTNCQSVRHQSGVNINPKDLLGATLVNRPVLVINFSPDGELCISQFPSLDQPTVNYNLSKHLSIIFNQKELS